MEDSQQLVQKASRGDARAIDSLLEQHLPRLRAFVRLRMGPEFRAKESASDLVQSSCEWVPGSRAQSAREVVVPRP